MSENCTNMYKSIYVNAENCPIYKSAKLDHSAKDRK